jgi:hypothetical protein
VLEEAGRPLPEALQELAMLQGTLDLQKVHPSLASGCFLVAQLTELRPNSCPQAQEGDGSYGSSSEAPPTLLAQCSPEVACDPQHQPHTWAASAGQPCFLSFLNGVDFDDLSLSLQVTQISVGCLKSSLCCCSTHTAQAGLELAILLPQPPKYWDYRCVQLPSAQSVIIKVTTKEGSQSREACVAQCLGFMA